MDRCGMANRTVLSEKEVQIEDIMVNLVGIIV